MSRATFALCLSLAALGSATAVDAQGDLLVRGRIIGPDNNPVAEQRVVLHRVDQAGGSTIAETLSAADGRFELRAPAQTDTEALLFVAARYEGELYIGPPFRAGEAVEEQVIQVGVPELSASALLEQGGGLPLPEQQRPGQGRTWLLVLVPLLGVVGAIVYAVIPKGRVPPDRARLIRIAEIDERIGSAPAAHQESLRAERQRLMAELRQG
jgi:hypothetical protein